MRPWAGRENTVGVKHVEGLDLGVEELVGARRLPAVELVGHGELRVEAARQDDLEEGEVPERVRPRPLQQVADLALVVPHPELDVLDVGLAAEAVLVVEVGGRLEVGHPEDLLLLVAAALL